MVARVIDATGPALKGRLNRRGELFKVNVTSEYESHRLGAIVIGMKCLNVLDRCVF